MTSSIDNGGLTHIKYVHFHFPRVIELVCPKCRLRAMAINVDAPEEVEHFIDIANYQMIWGIKCLTCDYRKSADWEQTKELDLWLKINIRNIRFWAWNTKHLKMLLKRLNNENVKSDEWEFFTSYIPGVWLSKLCGTKEVDKIKKLLKK